MTQLSSKRGLSIVEDGLTLTGSIQISQLSTGETSAKENQRSIAVGPYTNIQAHPRPGDKSVENDARFTVKQQALQISIEDSTESWWGQAAKTVWKLTQRIYWTASNQLKTVQVPCQIQSWEETLKEVDGVLLRSQNNRGPLDDSYRTHNSSVT